MRIVAVTLLVFAIATGCGSDQRASPAEETSTTTAERPASDPARRAAPPLAGRSLGGEPIALADFRGRPVLINVWSSW